MENHNIGRLSGTITQSGFVEKAKIYVKSIVTTREANFLGFQFIAINSALFIAINSIKYDKKASLFVSADPDALQFILLRDFDGKC